MSKVFKVWPKKVRRVNGTVLTPEMDIVVTTKIGVSNPFYNNAQEIKEAYMRLYQFDYKKACCSQSDFNYTALDWGKSIKPSSLCFNSAQAFIFFAAKNGQIDKYTNYKLR